MRIKISDIIVPDGLPAVKNATVVNLAGSIKTIGLIQPITVRRDGNGYVLIAGAHRLAACMSLGWDEIESTVLDVDGLKAELVGIDENLIRNEFHYTERGDYLKRRKEIYEELYPETKAGIAGGKARQKSASEIISFAGDAAAKIGVSTRTVEQEIQISEKLTPEEKAVVRERDLPKKDALKIARMKPEERKPTVEKIAEGKSLKQIEIEAARQKSIAQVVSLPTKPALHIGCGIKWIAQQPQCDLLFTDPPFSTHVPDGYADIEEFANHWLPIALSKVKSTGCAYVFVGAYPPEVTAYMNVKIPDYLVLTDMLVWCYGNVPPTCSKTHYRRNGQLILYYRGEGAPPLDSSLTSEMRMVQEFNHPSCSSQGGLHPWQKPMELAERFIRHSTKAGDVVYDPFTCTGTFLLAANKLGRVGFGAEINEEHAAIAIRRGCVVEGVSSGDGNEELQPDNPPDSTIGDDTTPHVPDEGGVEHALQSGTNVPLDDRVATTASSVAREGVTAQPVTSV